MKKTVTTNTFAGPLATTYELVRNETFSTIRAIEQNGKSLKNKWGGYSVRNVGKPAYINKIWKEL